MSLRLGAMKSAHWAHSGTKGLGQLPHTSSLPHSGCVSFV